MAPKVSRVAPVKNGQPEGAGWPSVKRPAERRQRDGQETSRSRFVFVLVSMFEAALLSAPPPPPPPWKLPIRLSHLTTCNCNRRQLAIVIIDECSRQMTKLFEWKRAKYWNSSRRKLQHLPARWAPPSWTRPPIRPAGQFARRAGRLARARILQDGLQDRAPATRGGRPSGIATSVAPPRPAGRRRPALPRPRRAPARRLGAREGNRTQMWPPARFRPRRRKLPLQLHDHERQVGASGGKPIAAANHDNLSLAE